MWMSNYSARNQPSSDVALGDHRKKSICSHSLGGKSNSVSVTSPHLEVVINGYISYTLCKAVFAFLHEPGKWLALMAACSMSGES